LDVAKAMKHAANAKQGLQNCQQKETVIDPKIQQIQALNATSTPTPTTQPYGSKASNRLFSALPLSDWTRWTGHLEMVELKLGEVLFEPGRPLSHLYFPVNSIVSLQCNLEDGTSSEFGLVGNEGMVGVFLFMGTPSSISHAIVIRKGMAYRFKAELILKEFEISGAFRRLILRYMQAMMTEASQRAACHRRHAIDQQLCRIILLCLDRTHNSELTLTHELIARTMGVRREAISMAANKLQAAGMISSTRGQITVLDRQGIESVACECYKMVKREFDRLLPEEIAS
jgi:CRP-like cAMP-binding protein